MNYYKTDKKRLLAILRQKGNCVAEEQLLCRECPLHSVHICSTHDEAYERAKNIFAERYGIDKLVEELL